MATRPRAAVLADEARRAFEGLLGEWVYHRLDYHGADHGIDGQVEIFAGGETTGLKFEVQLKGTDAIKPTSGATARLDARHAVYYDSLALPVLVVVYASATGQVHHAWWHAQDRDRPLSGARTFTFRIPPGNVWGPGTKDQVRLVVEARTAVRAADLPVPLRLRLDGVEGAGDDAWAAERLAVRAALTALDDIVRLRARDEPPQALDIALSVRGGTVELAFAQQRLVRVVGPSPDPATTPGPLGASLWTAVALVLASAGRARDAVEVVRRSQGGARLHLGGGAAVGLAGALLDAGAVTDALDLAERCRAAGEPDEVWAPLAMVAFHASERMTDAEDERYTSFLQTVAGSGDDVARAAATYNLGSHQRLRRRFDLAVAEYERAAVLDPSYVHRPYYWREFGGVRFMLHEFAESAKCYADAAACASAHNDDDDDAGDGHGPDLVALQADALLYAGECARSAALFAEWHVQTADIPLSRENSEWLLKHHFADSLVAHGHVRQDRDTLLAISLAHEPGPGETFTQARARLEQALQADALWGSAWFNLGVLLESTSPTDTDEVAFVWLAAALSDLYDAESWANALLAALRHPPDSDLLWHIPAIVWTGNRLAGEQFIEQCQQSVAAGSDPATARAVLALLETVIDDGTRSAHQ